MSLCRRQLLGKGPPLADRASDEGQSWPDGPGLLQIQSQSPSADGIRWWPRHQPRLLVMHKEAQDGAAC